MSVTHNLTSTDEVFGKRKAVGLGAQEGAPGVIAAGCGRRIKAW